jgi:hypothetical protein
MERARAIILALNVSGKSVKLFMSHPSQDKPPPAALFKEGEIFTLFMEEGGDQ